METTTQKRDRIEQVVNGHPQFSKVSGYLAERFNLDQTETQRKFIDFLVKEDFQYFDNLPHNVLCFEFDINSGEFINRTKVCGTNYPTER